MACDTLPANSVVIANSASAGGALYLHSGCGATVANCTFAANTATDGRAVACAATASSLNTGNSILWDGGDEVYNPDGSAIAAAYSDVFGGWTGTGNIDADAMFVDPANGDYRLWPGSPCIDAGRNGAVPADVADLHEDGDTGAQRCPGDLGTLLGNCEYVCP